MVAVLASGVPCPAQAFSAPGKCRRNETRWPDRRNGIEWLGENAASSGTITLLTDPLAGTTAAYFLHEVIRRDKPNVSIMPPGFLFSCTAEEVADLLAFVGAK